MKEIELYQREDGFWAGRLTTDGRMAAGAHRITGEEIMTMFTEFFRDYLRESGQDKLLMRDGEGRIFVTMMAGQTAQQQPAKAEAPAAGPAEAEEAEPAVPAKKARTRRKKA